MGGSGTKRGPLRGAFLTERDREVLRAGPELPQAPDERPPTKRIYKSREKERERRRRRQKEQRHARRFRDARNKARKRALLAIDDLLFLLDTMDDDWIRDVLTHSNDQVPGFTAWEVLLSQIVFRTGLERFPRDADAEASVPQLYLERLVRAANRGLVEHGGRVPGRSLVLVSRGRFDDGTGW